jgi:hypothetical protein
MKDPPYILLHIYPQTALRSFIIYDRDEDRFGVTQGAGGSGLSPDQMGVGHLLTHDNGEDTQTNKPQLDVLSPQYNLT